MYNYYPSTVRVASRYVNKFNIRRLYFYILHTTVWIWLFTYFNSLFCLLEREERERGERERREIGEDSFFYVGAFNTSRWISNDCM